MIDLFKRLFKVAFAEWKLFYTDPAAVLLLVVAGVLYAFYYPTPSRLMCAMYSRMSAKRSRPWRMRKSTASW